MTITRYNMHYVERIDEHPEGQWVKYADVARLHAELQSLRADAERYRWLCDGHGYFMEEEGLCGHGNDKAEADKAIDDARSRK